MDCLPTFTPERAQAAFAVADDGPVLGKLLQPVAAHSRTLLRIGGRQHVEITTEYVHWLLLIQVTDIIGSMPEQTGEK